MFDKSSSFDLMHDSIKSKNKKIASIIGTAAILFAVLRVIVTRFYVDPDIHFYTLNAAHFFDYATAVGIIALYITSIFLYRYKKDEHHYSATAVSFVQGTLTQVFTAMVAGVMLAASAVLQLWSLFANRTLPVSELITNYMQNNKFDFLIFFAAILSSVYFFKTAAMNQDNAETQPGYSQMHIMMSFMPILWSFLNTFKCFFDMSKSVNSPVKIYELMCFLTLSAYFVSESRMLVGKHEIAKFFTFAYIAAIFIVLSALPNLILSSFWIMQTNSANILYAVQISFALYIGARVYSQIRYGAFTLECLK